MPVIKRYPNRKLYDTERKQYINLSDIARMIRQGKEIQVLDHATNDDLTALTLTQVILEAEKKQAGFLPRSLLSGLIRAGEEHLHTLYNEFKLDTYAFETGFASYGIPTREDIDRLHQQLEELAQKISALEH
jgi:polyhydroxyalkanoate synthesis repressor PhaR